MVTKSKCNRCKKIIKERAAYFECKEYCRSCFYFVKRRSYPDRRSISELWKKFIKKGRM